MSTASASPAVEMWATARSSWSRPQPPSALLSGAWVGTFWDRSGVPDPEALLLEGRDEAARWVREPPAGAAPPVSVEEQPWFVAATYARGDDEEYAVAHRLKLVS
jgi:hypothetical protein